MKLTREHVRFLAFSRLSKRMRDRLGETVPDVHRLINDSAGIKTVVGVNALHLVKLRRKNEPKLGPLIWLAPSPWDKANCISRWHCLNRWQRRYQRAMIRNLITVASTKGDQA